MPESNERGALTEAVYYILLSLFMPLHGYGIMQRVKEMSNGRVSLGAGTLYGALNTLVEKGFILPYKSTANSRRKEYVISEQGKSAIKEELIRLEELIENGKTIVGGMRK